MKVSETTFPGLLLIDPDPLVNECGLFPRIAQMTS